MNEHVETNHYYACTIFHNSMVNNAFTCLSLSSISPRCPSLWLAWDHRYRILASDHESAVTGTSEPLRITSPPVFQGALLHIAQRPVYTYQQSIKAYTSNPHQAHPYHTNHPNQQLPQSQSPPCSASPPPLLAPPPATPASSLRYVLANPSLTSPGVISKRTTKLTIPLTDHQIRREERRRHRRRRRQGH